MVDPNSSNSSTTGGNTKTPVVKQISPAIRWCFTLNNYTNDEVSSIVSIFDEKAKLYVLGDEVGENNGVPHIQGYVEFKTKSRPKSIISQNSRIHWEKARGSPGENINYCSKMKVLKSKGLPKPIKVIENLFEWQKNIESIYNNPIDDRAIYWFWSAGGGIGKSAFIKYMVIKYKCLFCCGGKYSDIMNLVFNQDMDQCEAVFFDIPRASTDAISYSALESIKNGLVCNTKYETGCKVFNSPHIFVFANCEPSDLSKLSNDRWHITCLDD